mmetsp:Transcript_5241/g.14500  ORF Transcript_5241/g.14500 Transcript_5241/m.14500 type:complete len:229 (+) Transcript_5241:1564-2250(+)
MREIINDQRTERPRQLRHCHGDHPRQRQPGQWTHRQRAPLRHGLRAPGRRHAQEHDCGGERAVPGHAAAATAARGRGHSRPWPAGGGCGQPSAVPAWTRSPGTEAHAHRRRAREGSVWRTAQAGLYCHGACGRALVTLPRRADKRPGLHDLALGGERVHQRGSELELHDPCRSPPAALRDAPPIRPLDPARSWRLPRLLRPDAAGRGVLPRRVGGDLPAEGKPSGCVP